MNSRRQELVNVQESFVKDLGLHYRILNMPTQELGASAYQKVSGSHCCMAMA